MNQIQQILAELLAQEPSLKPHEKEIQIMIEQTLLARPDVQIDKTFILNLRKKLLISAGLQNSSIQTNKFFMNKKWFTFGGAALASLVVILVVSINSKNPKFKDYALFGHKINTNILKIDENKSNPTKNKPKIKTFASKEEFLTYLQESQNTFPDYGGKGGGGGPVALGSAAPSSLNKMADSGIAERSTVQGNPDRVSQTNTQTQGIDEPDIVKTNGKEIYFSGEQYYGIYNQVENMQGITFEQAQLDKSSEIREKIMPYYPQVRTTKVINALPVSELKTIGKIDKQGELLLSGKTLMVFSYDGVFAYDISDPKNPKESWTIRYENSQMVSARLFNGKVYLVTRSYVDYSVPCPLKPLSLNSKIVEIPCPRIYYPSRPVGDTATFNAFVLDSNSGEIKNKLAFLGSYNQSAVYMSENNLYITYGYSKQQLEVFSDFLNTDGKNIFPSSISERLAKLSSLDISSQAKEVEMQNILQKQLSSLSEDDRLKLQNQLQNKIGDYLKAHSRELYSTGIAKIGLNKFDLNETGFVPGNILNQFSLDEYQGNLRIATTIGENFWIWGWQGGNAQTVNDIYILDQNLNQTGKVTDLGKGERIYSARFIGKLGYIVTFRQIDPFYVLDLSDPKNPQKVGELKIPGFSSYLHPLKENLILGIGQENGKVKLSLFDVANSKDPKEIDKYMLDEYWSEASNNHHAFLQDEKHNVFFLPGGNGGYVFSYKNNKLNLEKAVSKIVAKRALYINDLLYIIGEDKIVVLDEKTWERVKELDLR